MSTPRGILAGRGGAGRRARGLGRRGVVLLEVVLALALFFGGAMVILAGLSSSLTGIQRVQVETQAADLAVTMLSEIQMGLIPLTSDGPTDYEDENLADWTWEIAVEAFQEQQLTVELPEFQQVVITIRHRPSGASYSLTTLMTDEPVDDAATEDASDSGTGMGTGTDAGTSGTGGGRGTQGGLP